MPADRETTTFGWTEALTQIETILPADLFQLLTRTGQSSRFIRETMVAHPLMTAEILLWHHQVTDNLMAGELPGMFDSAFPPAQNDTDAMRQLRVFRRCHSAAIAVFEFSQHLPIESTAYRISVVADTLIQAAYQFAYDEQVARSGYPVNEQGRKQHMLVIAMGKLGGWELNFSSDIDLIFFYPGEGRTREGAREIDNSRFFRRVSTQLIRLLDEVTAEGFVFRVDMRLRPYGESGALVISLAQAEDYYQEQGREWERFAMIRSRIVTGEAQDRQSLLDILRPFSFRRYIDYGVIDSIRDMKAMIQREVRRKGLVDNIKLGAGGIREVEFIVQSLQLIQGGRDKRLREPNVFKILPLLVKAKLLPQQAQIELLGAYQFLRRLEHLIQGLAEKQTQQLPENKPEQSALATSMGYGNWPMLREALSAHQNRVNQHFNELLGEERKQTISHDEPVQLLSEGLLEADALAKYMREKNAREQSTEDCETIVKLIRGFIDESAVKNLSTKGSSRLKNFFPTLISVCLQSQAPAVTLQRLLKVLRAILKRTAYLELLSENPPVLNHLVELAGRSEWVVQRLSDYPVLFDELLYPNSLYEPLQKADLRSELQQSLLRINTDDEEELLEAMRAFKQINELRLAAALLAERLSISQVSRYLTQLAEVVLQATVEQCWILMTAKHGYPASLLPQPGNTGFAVIGYGKLGGGELGFGSDLDLVFLFDQSIDESTNGKRSLANTRFYTRLAQKIIHFLSVRTSLGLLYEVDMRLRPSGASGLLVSHTDAYFEYQMESAWTWEHQALIRARFVAGDQALQPVFDSIRGKVLAKPRDNIQLKKDVVNMRQKMREHLESKSSGKVDLKQSPGGLVDIEFLAQYFCLAYQGEKPIPHSTIACIQLARDEAMLPQEDALLLIRNYRALSNRLNEMALSGEGNLAAIENYSCQLQEVVRIWQKVLLD